MHKVILCQSKGSGALVINWCFTEMRGILESISVILRLFIAEQQELDLYIRYQKSSGKQCLKWFKKCKGNTENA